MREQNTKPYATRLVSVVPLTVGEDGFASAGGEGVDGGLGGEEEGAGFGVFGEEEEAVGAGPEVG
jgi:hypothetical protein